MQAGLRFHVLTCKLQVGPFGRSEEQRPEPSTTSPRRFLLQGLRSGRLLLSHVAESLREDPEILGSWDYVKIMRF